MVKASPSKMSMVAMGDASCRDWISGRECPRRGARHVAAAISASLGVPAKTRSWRLTMAGPRTTADGRRVAPTRICFAPEHGDGGFGAVDGGRVVRRVVARGGDLAQHRSGLERAGGDGDRLAGVVAEGFPDEGSRRGVCLRPAWS